MKKVMRSQVDTELSQYGYHKGNALKSRAVEAPKSSDVGPTVDPNDPGWEDID
jgi:hypothetical protein